MFVTWPSFRGAAHDGVERLSRRLASSPGPVVAHNGRFAGQQANPCCQHRAGQHHHVRTWLTCSVAVWTYLLVLYGQMAERGLREDHMECRLLTAQTLARLRLTRLLADGGSDSEAKYCWWREDLGLESIILPVTGRPARRVTSPRYCSQRQLAFPDTVYGEHWKAELLIIIVKRRFGGVVTVPRYWVTAQIDPVARRH